MTRRTAVVIGAGATSLLVAVLLFPVMGDSRGSLSMLGTPVPSEDSRVAVAAAIGVGIVVGALLARVTRGRARGVR